MQAAGSPRGEAEATGARGAGVRGVAPELAGAQRGEVEGAEANPTELTYEQQFELAERFAPVLLFHEAEEFFPCSPLFPLDLDMPASERPPDERSGGAVIDGEKPAEKENADENLARPSLVEALGDVESRTDTYRSLSLSSKADLARVFFHAYPFAEDGEQLVVVEYWFYYVENQYQAEGGLFPVRVDTSHPNDMEHVFVVLRPRGGHSSASGLSTWPDAYAIKTIYASAHHGNLPNNTYTFTPGQEARQMPPLMVELGSHAVAADIDGDGRFTPGIDSTWNGKFVWGIRDTGKTWARYDPAYMEPRQRGDSVVLFYGVAGSSAPKTATGDSGAIEPTWVNSYPYRLEHVATLASQFEWFQPSKAQIDETFRVPVAWPKRLFGRSDGGPEKLFIPSEHENFGNLKQLKEGYARIERGLTVGYTNILYGFTFLVGGRYAFINGSKLVPDVIVEGQAMLTGEGNDYYEVSLLGYYPIDTISKIFVGTSLITDDIRFDKRQYDLLGGLEFRLSSFRFRVAYRSTGAVSRAKVDFRIYYLPF